MAATPTSFLPVLPQQDVERAAQVRLYLGLHRTLDLLM